MQKILIFSLIFLLGISANAQETLPMITISAAQLNYAFTQPGQVTVDGETYDITIKYRGMYSATFTGKRNYSFHLKDKNGEQVKAPLLSLRNDDDYVLLGALNDPSRLRNAVGMDLWRDLGYPAPAHAACELTFAQYYKGLYFLFERPDRKSAGVPRDGALYRVLAARVDEINALVEDAPAPTEEVWYNIGKVYPETNDGWQPLLTMLEDPENHLNFEAFADYLLFVNLIGATDNLRKNLYLCYDGEAFYPMPWDLDAAFGRLYNAEPNDENDFYTSPFFRKLLEIPAFQQALKTRYETLKKTLSPECITARFEEAYRALEKTGVWEREKERFPDYTDATTDNVHPLDPVGEISALPAFLHLRSAIVDAFIATLP